jgi:hypothetical protein
MATYTNARTPPSSSKTGIPVVVDTSQLSRLAKDLRLAAPEVWKAYRVTVRKLAQPLLAGMQRRASYSTRIPASGKIRVTSGGNVKIVFGGDAAPNAAAIENRGRGFVRHPIPNTDAWTEKNSHPAFMSPELDAHVEEVAKGVGDAVVVAVERALRGGL